MNRLGSTLAIAMMVGGNGTPPLAAWLGPDLISAARCGMDTVSFGSGMGSHVRRAHALPYLVCRLITRGQVVCVL